jgi:uncharacterized damage-inducible protein DinB
MSDLRPWIRALQEVLLQGSELARRLDAPGEQAHHLEPVPALGLASVGAHLRHVADFVAGFLRGFADGVIDYDARERDARLEREPARAAAELARLARELEPLGTQPAARALRVLLEQSAVGGAPAWQDSSAGRELAFLLSHTIHHHALIAAALRARGREPGAEFGLAPSTRAHREAAACAPPAG